MNGIKLATPLGIVGTLGVAAVGGSVAGIILASSGGASQAPTPVTVQRVAANATDTPTPVDSAPAASPTDLAPVQSPTVTQETVKAAPVQTPAAQASTPPAPPVYTPPVVVDSQGRRCAVDSTGSISVVNGVCSAY